MKIKKYITAIVLAMSLTTGLVVANAANDGVVKTKEIKKENKKEVKKVKDAKKAGENKKAKETKNEVKKAAEINPYVIGYNFKGKGMPEDPQKAFLQTSEQNPYNFDHKANTPEAALFLYIVFNELFENEKLDKDPLYMMLAGELYYAYLDKNGKVISLFYNPGYCVYDNCEKPEEMEKFKKAFKKYDFSKIEITKEKFKLAMEQFVRLVEKEIKILEDRLEQNKKILKLLGENKYQEAVKFAEKSIRKNMKKFSPDKLKQLGDERIKELAKNVCADINMLKEGIKFTEQRKEILPKKIELIKKLKFDDVKKLKNIFKMQEKVLEVPPYPAK